MNINHNTSLPFIDKNDWLRLLQQIEDSGRKIWIDSLLMFFYQPDSMGTFKDISSKYAIKRETVSILIDHIADYINNAIVDKDIALRPQQKLELIFEISQENKDVYRLHGPLVSAIRTFLIDRLINKYRENILSQGLDNDNCKELYKWKILSEHCGETTEEILSYMCTGCHEMNFLNWRIIDHIKNALKECHDETIDCFDELRNMSGDFYEKFSSFVSSGKKFLSKESASYILKENVASVFLSFVSPTDFVIYRWTVYEFIFKYLGFKPDKRKPYDGYKNILQEISERENLDTDLIEKIKSETASYFWNPLLNSQDIIWQTQSFIRHSYPKNWLEKLYEKGIQDSPWIFQYWTDAYTGSVKTFLNMFADGKTSDDVDAATKDLFLRVKDNSISSNGQGMYSYEEYGRILEHWDEIFNILKRNVDANTISLEDYRYLGTLIQSLLNKRKPSAYHRIWAAIFPQKLCTIIERNAFNSTYEKIRQIDDSLPPLKDTWVESNIVLMDYFKDKVNFIQEYHRPIFAWYLKENLNIDNTDPNMDKYVELLKANHNLILTGAPGTGKTYLAKEIAKAMGDLNPGFVQFHPSLDYSDFVEGLRPISETGSFERTDGIFKKFCKEAISGVNFTDFDIAYDSFVNHLLELPEDERIVKIIAPKSGAEFGVSVNSKSNLNLHTGKSFTQQGVIKRNDLKRLLSGEKVYDYWKGYYEGVIQYLKDHYQLKESEKPLNANNKIFIIDEINRGELSKIFGELFFSIEPSYRGEKHRVFTQYQNLVLPGDPFEKGFYIPDNVYIIGTMNDIDRGVESMDFAIRRRFGWLEIEPEERKDMLFELIPEYAEQAVKVMESINKALTDKEIGLPEAFKIGPAYFLKLSDYKGDFEKLWNFNIRSLLYEYLRGDRAINKKMEILKTSFFKP